MSNLWAIIIGLVIGVLIWLWILYYLLKSFKKMAGE